MNTIKFRQWDAVNRRMTELKELELPWNQKRDGKHVMMWTGLLDRQGKEIYEGDILQTLVHKTNAPVEWCDGGFVADVWELLEFVQDGCKVIGNIYENKDLLE